MASTLPYPVTMSNDTAHFEVEVPNFSHVAYSGAGLLSPWYIVSCFEHTRAIAGQHDFLKTGECVLIGSQYTFNWDSLSTASRNTRFPYRVTHDLTHVGNSSFTMHNELLNALDNKTLATLDAELVYFNLTTGQSLRFPDDFLQKYARFRNTNFEKTRISMPIFPNDALIFTIAIEVLPSHVSRADHVAASEQLRCALDCVAAASRKNHFKYVKGDVRALWLSTLKVFYRNICLMGDVLTISAWEGEKTGDICCVIKKENELCSFHMMTFIVNHSHL